MFVVFLLLHVGLYIKCIASKVKVTQIIHHGHYESALLLYPEPGWAKKIRRLRLKIESFGNLPAGGTFFADCTCWSARKIPTNVPSVRFFPDNRARGVTPFHELRVPVGKVSLAHWGIFFKLEVYTIEALLATILRSLLNSRGGRLQELRLYNDVWELVRRIICVTNSHNYYGQV